MMHGQKNIKIATVSNGMFCCCCWWWWWWWWRRWRII